MTKRPKPTTTKRQQGGAKSVLPRFVRLRLQEIEFDRTSRYCALLARLRYPPQAIPTLTQTALALLEHTQPMIVIRKGEPDKPACYRLVAGFRTFQLLAEQRPRAAKCLAVVLSNCSDQEIDHYGAFDSTVVKLIQRPNGDDLAIIAATLHRDTQFRKEISEFMPIATDNQLAGALGMSRSTLNRQISEVTESEIKFGEKAAVTSKIDIDLPFDDEVPEQ